VFLVFALLMTRVARARNELERRVAERTAELTRSNDNLKREIAEHNQAEYLTGLVFESSPDGISIVGTDYRYERVNPVYDRNFGRPVGSIVGMHVADLWGIELFEHKLRPFLDRCFAGETVSFEDWFDSAPGRRYFAMSYSPLRPDSQGVEAALVISRDLTEHTLASEALRHAQADLAHASRMTTMGELTASLAHEVNQPITAAVNGASTCVRWLTRDDPDLGEAREAALGVIRNAKRAADIINRIRSISKKGESKRQLADVNELIREMIALLRNEASRYSISIRTDLDAALPKIMADPVQVQQVMMNLIMNSIDAMKDVDQTRELSIGSRRAEDQQLMISVSDTGVGLPRHQIDQIFDAFFTTKPHGIGMGLRISRSIVESHGGRLWATDNSPCGASFYFTLPNPVEARE
jgi:PAS domain S-box-containing protein